MKRIEFCIPIDCMRGNLSGRQLMSYTEDGGKAYDAPDGVKTSAINYQPRLVAAKVSRTGVKYFIVRTRSSVNMTANARLNMALMGGAGAIYAALLSDKTSAIYAACINAWAESREDTTFRAFMIRKIRPALAAKESTITIADGVTIDNPWQTSGTPNVPVTADVLTKFAPILTN